MKTITHCGRLLICLAFLCPCDSQAADTSTNSVMVETPSEIATSMLQLLWRVPDLGSHTFETQFWLASMPPEYVQCMAKQIPHGTVTSIESEGVTNSTSSKVMLLRVSGSNAVVDVTCRWQPRGSAVETKTHHEVLAIPIATSYSNSIGGISFWTKWWETTANHEEVPNNASQPTK